MRPSPRVLSRGRFLATGLLLLGAAGVPGSWCAAQAVAAASAHPEVQPGGFVSLPFLAGGAVAGTYAVEATLPAGWTLLSDSVQLGDSAPPLLNVYVPDDALAGVQQLDFRLTGAQDHILDMRAQVVVPTRTAFTLDFPTTGRVRPGEHRMFTAHVTNTGNALDTLMLKVEGNATITPDRLTLKAGGSGTVQVAYVQQGQGNADSVTLSAVSTVTPTVRQEAILALGSGMRWRGAAPS